MCATKLPDRVKYEWYPKHYDGLQGVGSLSNFSETEFIVPPHFCGTLEFGGMKPQMSFNRVRLDKR